jgi:hypothetical protein
MSPSCASCVSSSEQCLIGSCETACVSTVMMGGSGGVGTSSGGGSSSGGAPTTETECTPVHMACSNGQSVEVCITLTNGACTSEYYQVVFGDNDGGSQDFECASCTDTASCVAQTMAACQ